MPNGWLHTWSLIVTADWIEVSSDLKGKCCRFTLTLKFVSHENLTT